MNIDKKSLFVFFCGTDEPSGNHLTRFMRDVHAGHHIYINGLGSKITDYKGELADVIETPINVPDNNKSKYYSFELADKKIHCIEKKYTGGSASGYAAVDCDKVANYMAAVLSEVLKKEKINSITFAGHSRGAAVGLASFLHFLAKNRLNKGKDATKENLIKDNTKISIVFLDPVAGQTGNNYPYYMPSGWNSTDLYESLDKLFGNQLFISEIYAKSAVFMNSGFSQTTALLADFNPAKRFMDVPKVSKSYKYVLGYFHSALVNENNDKPYIYQQKNVRTPYRLVVDYFNSFIEVKSILYARFHADFQGSNHAIEPYMRKNMKDLFVHIGRRTGIQKSEKMRRLVNFEEVIRKTRN